MKIAFICQALCGGGTERVTVSLANGLCSKNDVHLITGEIRKEEYKLHKEVKRHCIIGGGLIKDFLAVRKCIKQYSIDVIIGMGIYANFLACLTYKQTKAKTVISERNSPYYDKLSYKSRVLRKLLYNRADGYVFQTKQSMEYYSNKIQHKGIVIHNPIISELPKREGVITHEIIAIGRLEPQKNYTMLIRAFAKFHEKDRQGYSLRIFGKGSELKNLKNLCSRLNIDGYVFFEGYRLDVHTNITHSDIYVLSSDFEGMPNALMEAMAMGFPVIATDCPCGGVGELIVDSMNGFLVPVRDISGLCERILYLTEHSSIKEKIASNARLIYKNHNIMEITKKWENYLKEVISL